MIPTSSARKTVPRGRVFIRYLNAHQGERMMQKVTAELVEQIGTGATSTDGKYMLLKLTMHGKERMFAPPTAYLLGLMISYAASALRMNVSDRADPVGSSTWTGLNWPRLETKTWCLRSSSVRVVVRDLNSTVPGAERLVEFLLALLSRVTSRGPQRQLN
jgi:hypothetical protein